MNKSYAKVREIAMHILFEVIHKKKYSNKLLALLDQKYLLMEKDKKLIYKIVYGTLQNKIFLEFIINNYINQNKSNDKIQILLWLSLYQIYFLNKIPPYAIVNEAVEIAKSVNKIYGNFVNAVLNKIIRSGDILKFLENSNDLTTNEKYLIKYSMPNWIYELIKNYYLENDVKKFIEDNINEPKLSYRVNTNKISYQQFISLFSERYFFVKSTIVKTGITGMKSLINTPLFYDGYIIAQDEMSQMISEVLDPKKNELILDMCAAPGGKTTHISQLMENTGVIDALEISPKKIEILEENINKLNCQNINIHNLNALKYEPTFLYDKILLDSPCSGLGVLKRKPEIKYYNVKKLKISNLIKEQSALLSKAYKLLKVGGILVYSTCTINFFENENQITNFVKRFPDMEIITKKQVFGFETNTDGFYYCKLIKRSIKN